MSSTSGEPCAVRGCNAVATTTTQIYRWGWRAPRAHRTCAPHHQQLEGQELTAKRWRELLSR